MKNNFLKYFKDIMKIFKRNIVDQEQKKDFKYKI